MTVSTHKTFTFDTEKWIENRGIQRCSRITKSVILDMMIYSVKHNGTFRIDDKSAIRIGATNEELQHALSEIQQFNVTTIEDGMITFDCISSFLQKKEKVSEKRREAAEKRWGKQEEIPLDANACDEIPEPSCPFMEVDKDKKTFVCKCMSPWNTTEPAYMTIPKSYFETTYTDYTIDSNIYNTRIYNFRRGGVGGKPFVESTPDRKPVIATNPIDRELLARCELPEGYLDFANFEDDSNVGCNTNPAGFAKGSADGDSSLSEGVLTNDMIRSMGMLKKRLKKAELSDSEKKFCEWWCMYPTERRRGGSFEKHYDLWKKNCKGNEEQVLAYANEYLYPFNEELKETVYCMHSIRFLRTKDWENFDMENDE